MRAKCLSHENNLGQWSALNADICYLNLHVLVMHVSQCSVAKLTILIIYDNICTSFSEKGLWTSVSRSTLTGGSFATFSVD